MDRREFVHTMAGAGLAIACTPSARSLHAARIGKVGLQLYTVREQMKADFEGTIAHVAQIGY
jgi:hypothetical protein